MVQDKTNALVVEVPEGGSPALVQKAVPVPALASNQVLVKVSAVAQNPTDGNPKLHLSSHFMCQLINWLVQAFDTNAYGDGTVLGCDFAGTVEAVGSDVTRVSKGDTIAGPIWGGVLNDDIQRAPMIVWLT